MGTSECGSTATVIIPAHDEALVIGRCLRSVLAQHCPVRVRIVVAANGCSDATAPIARATADAAHARGFELIVLETERAQKAAALDMADEHALPGPRIYLDADAVLGPGALASMVAALATDDLHLCAPAIRLAPSRSRATSGYGRVWGRLPTVRSDVVGSGLYAVSEAGRRRWGAFPAILSEDKFVRLLFEPGERRVLHECWFEVRLPEGLREIVRVRGRWCRGNRELAATYPAVNRRDRRMRWATLRTFADPHLWRSLPMFLLIFVLGELSAWRRRGIGATRWERALGARQVAGAPSG